MRQLMSSALLLLSASACVGTTGGDILDFRVFAAGKADHGGEPLVFQTTQGYQVQLEFAKLHIGALYLGQALPVSGAQNTSCILPGTYVAQVTAGRDVDLLSGALQEFPILGHGTTAPARVGQVWLTGGDVNRVADPTVILELRGSAARAGKTWPFSAKLSIGNNRQVPGDVNPGANPICKQRIVSPIATDLRVQSSGALLLRVEPERLFVNVDFSALTENAGQFEFADDSSDQPSANLYQNLRANGGFYKFAWINEF